jgi:peptidoglycan-N-acetylmuramic acid deacetylase
MNPLMSNCVNIYRREGNNMRKRPSLLLAVGLVVLIGLVFLGAKYGPAMLDNNHAIPPAENVDPSAEPDETQHPEEPVEPEPGDPDTPSQEAETPDEPTGSLSNAKMSWYFTRNSNHQVPAIPNEAKIITKYRGMYVGDTSRRVVYLTFDNGYENGYTTPILDALRDNQVKALFFVTESYINRNPEIIKRMVAEGHAVCNHTSTHPSMPDISDSQIENEIRKTEEAFQRVTGTRMPPYLRPPSGEYSERTLAVTRNLGYSTVFWSMAFKDWDVNNQPGADYSYNHVMTNVHPGAIILLHAVSSSNAEAMDRILKDLKAEGYEFSLLP